VELHPQQAPLNLLQTYNLTLLKPQRLLLKHNPLVLQCPLMAIVNRNGKSGSNANAKIVVWLEKK
jgi:hypothetical protein